MFKGLPFPINNNSPVNAITIPEILMRFNFSLRKIKPSKAIKIGAVPIIQPVFAAVVYFNPVI